MRVYLRLGNDNWRWTIPIFPPLTWDTHAQGGQQEGGYSLSWASLCVLWKLYLQYDRPSAVPKDSAIAQVEQVSRLSPTEHQRRKPIGVKQPIVVDNTRDK